ncbi:hypothetical protein AMECASPLE_001392 [Ameca splendens]|uniref:Spindle and kinetochore-associated protein 3 n=1 Tax=Ameca splendens TaxID=208324 RepID=A0ABV1A4B1_9TELE
MDPTREFFSKLRKLAVTVETETERLQRAFENRRNEDGDSETAVRGMRAYHEVNSEVSSFKKQLLEQLAEQKQRENEVSSFIKACRVMKQRVSKDICTIGMHLEKYGYQAPCDAENPNNATDQEAEEDETSLAVEDGSQEGDEGINFTTPTKVKQPFTNGMKTPQLSDFGLSELQLKRALCGADWSSEVPPMPEMNLPQPSLQTPAPPRMAMTPKCALRMDDDELQTPQMRDFGISEHTMFLNNDFTMDLFRKKDLKPERPSQDIPVPSVNSVMESLQTKVDNLESPEPPVLCTPGFKIKKSKDHCLLPSQDARSPESPCHHGNQQTTPEVPAFQTPYVNRLVSTNKPGPIDLQSDGDGHIFKLQTSPCSAINSSKPAWEYNVPEIAFRGVEDKKMPEMPNLESFLGNSLQTRYGRSLKVGKDTTINSLVLDEPTQEFSYGTPRIRTNYLEPSTPEMPDLSSVTQDICKLVSQAQMKKAVTAPVHSPVSSEKRKPSATPAKALSLVSQSEFQTLPTYLRLMTLSSLNQAVDNINRYTAEHHGETKEFTMEDLRRVISVGTMGSVYILCLKELQRLEHVDGVLEAAVYKLITAT